MRFANVRQLRINSNSVLKNLAQEDVVITNRGKPVAAIIYLDEDLLDAFVVAHHPTLMTGILNDWKRYKKGALRTYTLKDVERRISQGLRHRRTAKR